MYNYVMATIICDIDGTLLVGNRGIQKTVDFINDQAKTNRIVLVTGRPSEERTSTENALRRAGVRYNSLKMHSGPKTHESRIEFKRETGRALKSKGTVLMAIDNDPDARRAYSSVGIPTKSPSSLPEITKTLYFW